jgi:hypothetical protein
LAYQFTKQFQKVLTKINFFLKEVNKSNTTKQMRTEKTGSKETHGDLQIRKKKKNWLLTQTLGEYTCEKIAKENRVYRAALVFIRHRGKLRK